MKRILGIGLSILLLFTGCKAVEVEKPVFSITAEERTAYMEEMDDICYEYYWNYDKDSLIFIEGTVPNDPTLVPEYFAAASEVGFAMEEFAGDDAVLGLATLLHYNGDTAGEIICWFVAEELVGVYYLGGYDDTPYSLLERNPFLADGGFIAYENWVGMEDNFREYNGTLPVDGFVAEGYDNSGNPIVASISGNTLGLYGLSGNYLSRMRSKQFDTSQELLGAALLEVNGVSTIAVLLTDTEEHSHDVVEEETETTEVFSERLEYVMLYTYDWQEIGELPLMGLSYTGITADEGELLLFTTDAVERYRYNGDWSKVEKTYLKHGVTQAHIVDLDGDDEKEYFLTDGLDLYVYQKRDSGLLKIWSTHLGVENLYGALYSGDLNGDGVSEVYLCDSTGTTIRYILTERGLRSSNEDIDYGEAMYVSDFNGDGLDDYWRVETGAMQQGSLHLAQ